jgi:hypothetical protein
MEIKERGEPAFPHDSMNRFGQQEHGLTIRDYFAAKAIQGICACEDHMRRYGSYAKAASGAYAIADAMLEARK